jgi:hypothetical protein
MRNYEKENRIIDEKIKSELKPFLDGLSAGIDSRAHGLFRAAYLDFKERYERTREIRSYAMKGLFAKTHAVKDSIQLMFSYLGLVESLGTALADILIMLLVANGIDFHIERSSRFPRIKHALRMKDLEDEYTPLKAKLNFLKENGILTLPSIIDTETRNSIAHMNFEVKGSQVLTKGKPIEESLLESERKLLHASNTITDLLGRSIIKKVAHNA